MVNGLPAIKYFDSNENFLFEKGGPPMNYQTLFQKFKLITIYTLQGRQVENEEVQKITHKMTYVMTGVRTAGYDAWKKAKEAENAKMTHNKRKVKGWGKPMEAKADKKQKWNKF